MPSSPRAHSVQYNRKTPVPRRGKGTKMNELLGSATELSTALVSVFVGFALVLDSLPIIGILVPADVAVLAATTARSPIAALAVVGAVVGGTLAGWTGTFLLGRFLAGPLRRSWL